MSKKWKFSRSIFIAFVFSLLFGYITFLSPYYAHLFSRNFKSKIVETSKTETIKCGLDQICEDEVSVAWNDGGTSTTPELSALVIGRLWNTATVTCDSKVIAQYGDPRSVILTRDTFNKFHVITGEEIQACRNSRVEIRVYYRKNQRKGGFIDGLPFFTSEKEAKIVENFSKFVQEDLKIFNFCGAIVVLIFSVFIRIVTVDSTSGVRIKMSALSLLLASAQSGLLEIWLPFGETANTIRWCSSISFCIWLTYALIYMGNLQKLQRVFIAGGAVLCSLIFIFTNSQVDTLIMFSAGVSLLSALLFILQKTESYLFFSILMALSVSEFSGFRLIRSGYVAPTFISVLIAIENYRAFLSFVKVNRILKLVTLRKFRGSRRIVPIIRPSGFRTAIFRFLFGQTVGAQEFNAPESLSKQNDIAMSSRADRVHAIIKLFQRQFAIGRVTILNLTDPQQIQIYQYTSRSAFPKQIASTKLPAIFAHVVSTGNGLMNVHQDSALVESLRRGAPYNGFRSDYFTVLPVFAGTEVIGAIALTEYDPEQFRTSLNYSTFIFCLDILRSLLVEHLLNTPKTESLRKLAILTKLFSKGLPAYVNSPEKLLEYAGSMICESFGWRIMAASLDPENLLHVHNVINFDDDVKSQVMSGKIYAHKENRQGPLALAVHEKKPVIVPNVKWLEGVVHPNTMKFFGIHSTKTAAFVPVLDSSNHEIAKVIGVFWIEGVRKSEISYSDRELFLSVMKYLADAIERLRSQKELDHSLEKLAHFLPHHLLDTFLAEGAVSDSDFGYLLMIDLKGSTRLAHDIGNENFREFAAMLREELRNSLAKEGLVLQQYKWDAFCFTYTIDKNRSSRINIDQWIECIEPIMAKWKESLKERFGVTDEIRSISYRICFSYGDTSRGIVDDGTTKTWTFVGNAIAVVSKVEQASKSLPGTVFADESVVRFTSEHWVQLATTEQGLAIFGLKRMLAAADVKRAA